LCHELKETYEEIANDYEDLLFFAFNVKDDPRITKKLSFKGVPTITLMKVIKGQKTDVKKIAEPKPPDKKTWYTADHIKSFIEKEK
tara:strand:+ start:525 stop:782 length:258 start_codon:yes stop_codon:yes gene_type:complete